MAAGTETELPAYAAARTETALPASAEMAVIRMNEAELSAADCTR